ncbi:MAG TPA: PqqD family protein [candidate division Zixibacteria bacterium]|nr:PqqD family protein [candidate division Zixibacteria bacterium]
MSISPEITLQTKLQASVNVVVSQLDEELVMMGIENSAYYSIDDVGARAWELLAEPHTISGICDVISSEYKVSRAQCEQDMLEWLGEMVKENLVHVVEV